MFREHLYSLVSSCFIICLTPVFYAEALQTPSWYDRLSKVGIESLNDNIARMKNNEEILLPKAGNLLHLAALLQATEQAQQIIDMQQCDVNELSNLSGFTPLLIACKENDAPMVNILLANGANPDIVGQNGKLPLLEAIKHKNFNMASLLLNAGANPNKVVTYSSKKAQERHAAPLYQAIREADSQMVNLLLGYKASPNLILKGSTPLMEAVQLDDKTKSTKIVNALLQKGAEANYLCFGQPTPLHVAVASRNVDVIYLLLKAGANPNALNARSTTPLGWALRQICFACESENEQSLKDYCAIARLLLEFGAELSPQQAKKIEMQSVLPAAIQAGNCTLVKFCLDSGADVNGKNEMGNTPLHCVMNILDRKSAFPIAQLLLEREADVTSVNKAKKDPLDFLISFGCLDEEKKSKYCPCCQNQLESQDGHDHLHKKAHGNGYKAQVIARLVKK